MYEITREQIEAYRDSPSRLVTDFDRDMARTCLVALDRAEAANAELAWCMNDGRKRTAEAADLRSQLAACVQGSDAPPCEGCARPSVTTDSEGVPLCHECYVGCIYDDVVKPLQAEVARLKAENMCDACAGQGTALSGPCMCGGTGKMSDAAVYLRAEVARLKDQVAALVMLLREAMPVEGEHLNCNSPAIKNIEADFWDTHRRLWRMIENDLTAVAAAWREQVRREALEEAAAFVDEISMDSQGDSVSLDGLVQEIRALAGAGEEKPA